MIIHMVKIHVHLQEEELAALHEAAKYTGRSVGELVREAVRQVWTQPETRDPVALWPGKPKHTAVEHDSIYDEP